jgi:hypothetical protein
MDRAPDARVRTGHHTRPAFICSSSDGNFSLGMKSRVLLLPPLQHLSSSPSLCAPGNSTTTAIHRTQPFVHPYHPRTVLLYTLIPTSSTSYIFDMSGMLPAHVYGLRVPAGVGPIPAAIDFPASVSSFSFLCVTFASCFCRRMELC